MPTSCPGDEADSLFSAVFEREAPQLGLELRAVTPVVKSRELDNLAGQNPPCHYWGVSRGPMKPRHWTKASGLGNS